MTIYLAYGLFEGPLFAGPLKNELIRRGHSVTTDPLRADLIIAHSGAWCLLDQPKMYKKLVLVDPAYNDQRSAFAKSLSRLGYDFQHFTVKALPRYCYYRFLNIWYLLTRFRRWLAMNKAYHARDIRPVLACDTVYILRVSDPTWHNAAIAQSSPHPIRDLGGDHDSMWHQTDAIADILGL
jgi:hypothetical protein